MATLADLSALLTAVGAPASLIPQLTAIAYAENPTENAGAVVSDPANNAPNAISVGLWQINSPNFAWLSSVLGTPVNQQTLVASPQLQAASAVALATKTNNGLANWSTWLDYTDVQAGAQGLTTPQIGAASRVSQALASIGSGVSSVASSVTGSVTGTASSSSSGAAATGIDWSKTLNPFDPRFWEQNGGIDGAIGSGGNNSTPTPSVVPPGLKWIFGDSDAYESFLAWAKSSLLSPQGLLVLGLALGLLVLLFFFSRTGSDSETNVTIAPPAAAEAAA